MKWKITYILFIFIYFLSGSFLVVHSENKHIANFTHENSINKNDTIILVGDSRMEAIEKSKEDLNIPKNIVFVAKSGAKINWFNSNGIYKLKDSIKNKKNKYSVVFNMGVNDLLDEVSIKDRVKEYFDLYYSVIEKNPNISFYILSVNPVIDEIIKPNRNNDEINTFNNEIIKLINKNNIKNLKYCDSNNELSFGMPDGLHYDSPTNSKIIKYIIKDCIELFN